MKYIPSSLNDYTLKSNSSMERINHFPAAQLHLLRSNQKLLNWDHDDTARVVLQIFVAYCGNFNVVVVIVNSQRSCRNLFLQFPMNPAFSTLRAVACILPGTCVVVVIVSSAKFGEEFQKSKFKSNGIEEIYAVWQVVNESSVRF